MENQPGVELIRRSNTVRLTLYIQLVL